MEKILNYRFSSSFTIKALLQSSAGGIVEYYDFTVFLMMAKFISLEFFNGTSYSDIMATYGILAIGYISKPVGGIILSHFGDKIGRKPVFLTSIIIMAIFTLVIGFLPGYSSIGIFAPILLLIARLAQGLSLGGEVPGAITFVYEHMPRGKKIFGIALLLGGIYVGIFLGSFVSYVIGIVFTENSIGNYAWRIPFILGGIFGILVYYMRKDLNETPIFKHIKIQSSAYSLPILKIIKTRKLELFSGFFMTLSLESMISFFSLMLPAFLMLNCKFNYHDSFQMVSISNFITLISIIAWSFVFLKFSLSTKSMLLLSYPIFAILSFLFLKYLLSSIGLVYIILIFVGINSSMGNILYKSTLPELYEVKARYTGTGISYNFANALAGALTPLIITWTGHKTGIESPLFYIITMAIIGIVSVFLIKFIKKKRSKERKLEYSRVRIRDVKEIMTKDQKEFYEWAKGRKLNMRELDPWELEEIINSLPADQRQFYREKHNIK